MNEQGKNASALLAVRTAKPVFLGTQYIVFFRGQPPGKRLLEVGFAWGKAGTQVITLCLVLQGKVYADALAFMGLRLYRTLREKHHLLEPQLYPSWGTPDGNGIAGRWHLILGYYRFALNLGTSGCQTEQSPC